jgi:hypothetical protein
MGLKDIGRLQTIATFKIIFGILNFKQLVLLKIDSRQIYFEVVTVSLGMLREQNCCFFPASAVGSNTAQQRSLLSPLDT